MNRSSSVYNFRVTVQQHEHRDQHLAATTASRRSATPAKHTPAWRSALRLPEVRWAALATVLFAVGGLCQLAGTPAPVWWALYLGAYAAGGWEPALSGLQALREKTLDVDILMIVAAPGRGRHRPGARRRAADRDLRDLGCVGGGGDQAHPGLGALAADPRPGAGHAAA